MPNRYIEILKIRSLRGPSMWTYRPCLEAVVDIGDLEDAPSNTIPGFYERLSGWLPSLIEHQCSYGERGGFLRRVEEGTWPAHILEHVTLELQNLAGAAGGFGRARSTSRRGVYKVIVRCWHDDFTTAALYAARDLVMAAVEDRPFDVAAAVAKLHEMAEDLLLGPSTACIVDAATAKGRRIPAIRLNEGNLVQLGYGARQRRIWTAETDRTSAIGESISRDKDLTKGLLKSCGVPVPEGRIVANAEDAWEAAEEIGLPVVVKPCDGNHGRGVSTDLRSRENVEAAFALAEKEGSEVIVERFIPGVEHRLLVVGGKVVAAARGEEAWVTGDGSATVAQLIDRQINTDPRRGTTEDYPLNVIRIDDDPAVRLELERQGFAAEAVPPAGKRVLIQRNGNVAFDVTDQVHPRNAAAVCLAARIVGLDIAGVDLVAEDISRPLEEQGGAIVEVNAGPGLLMHLKPAAGTPRPVGAAIVDHLFPPGTLGQTGRIPVVGITAGRGANLVARLAGRLLNLAGKYVGVACSDGLFLNRQHVNRNDCAHWEAGQRVLINRSVEAAVIENGARAIATEGLAYDRCQVAVVGAVDVATALQPDCYIDDEDQLFKLLRTQVDVVLPDGAAVLAADDPLAARLAPLCDGEVIFFAGRPEAPALAEHLAAGRRAVLVRDGRVLLCQNGRETLLSSLATIPLATEPAGVDSVLAAVGAAWALGVSIELMRAGVETFEANL
ncbi:MAG TPA: cyanophycin synthetase [Rhodocyclaceae bacterium]|nr:cyanophycin synthetase [Rhodocyclaceae bacterium]